MKISDLWGRLRDKQLELILVDAERTTLKAEVERLMALVRQSVKQ